MDKVFSLYKDHGKRKETRIKARELQKKQLKTCSGTQLPGKKMNGSLFHGQSHSKSYFEFHLFLSLARY